MKKITFAMLIITIALSFGMGVFSSPLLANTDINGNENREKFLNIMTINKPQYNMVKKITKDKHNVEYMLTDEKDIKDFKYNKKVIDNVSNMDLFIYTGTSFEPWTSTFINELKKGNLGIINLSRGIRILNYDSEGSSKENPYYFEGIDEYKIALYNVKAAIQDRDPQNREYYEDNYNEAIKELDDSLSKYKKSIELLSDYTFITLNNNFDYITKSLNLNVMKVDNHEIAEFIKINDLDSKKVIIIEDGEEESKMDLAEYSTVKLWKYYGKMSFDELILYNIDQISKMVEVNNAS